MNFDRVTITGADDSIEPGELVHLSEAFPFVEWGILFSANHVGEPRWPSVGWLAELFEQIDATAFEVNLSAHLCGRWVRDLLAGNFSYSAFIGRAFRHFRRVQLNFHAEPQLVIGTKFVSALVAHSSPSDPREFIFQIDGVNDDLFIGASRNAHGVSVVPLFDGSHGAGRLPGEWPVAAYRGGRAYGDASKVYHGYAGGLGPDNLEYEIPRIAKAAGDARFWIDLETRVRSVDDRVFDLAKVRRCLETAAPFVAESAVVD